MAFQAGAFQGTPAFQVSAGNDEAALKRREPEAELDAPYRRTRRKRPILRPPGPVVAPPLAPEPLELPPVGFGMAATAPAAPLAMDSFAPAPFTAAQMRQHMQSRDADARDAHDAVGAVMALFATGII